LNFLGHVGLALLVASGMSAALQLSLLAVLWTCGIASIMAVVPDKDIRSAYLSHRGVTHSILFACTASIAIGALSHFLLTFHPQICEIAASVLHMSPFIAGFTPAFIGTATHLAGDVVTYSGIPLFWPSKKRFSLGLFGSKNAAVNIMAGLAGFAAFIALTWTV